MHIFSSPHKEVILGTIFLIQLFVALRCQLSVQSDVVGELKDVHDKDAGVQCEKSDRRRSKPIILHRKTRQSGAQKVAEIKGGGPHA